MLVLQRRRYCGQFLESEDPQPTGDTAVKRQNSESPAVPTRTLSVSESSASRSGSVSSAGAVASTSGVPPSLPSPPAEMMKLNLSVQVSELRCPYPLIAVC